MRLTRRSRIILLLETYPDVCDHPTGSALDQSHGGGKPGSRDLTRRGLWQQGSYAELERCLQRFRDEHYPKIGRHLAEHYLRRNAGGWARKHVVEKGVDMLCKWMPTNVYVPPEVVERAGYSVTEAGSAGRRLRRT